MRAALAVLVVVLIGGCGAAQQGSAPEKRHGIEADLKTYSQATPKETLASVIKAIDNKRADYLLAQLADPDFVDRRVKDLGGKFDVVVRDTTQRLVDDPGPARQFQRFLKEGDWDVQENTAMVHLKEIADRAAFFRKENGRWFLENRNK